MPRNFQLQAVTANRLTDGVVVYLGESATWVRSIHSARVAETPEVLEKMIAESTSAEAEKQIISVYAVPVRLEQTGEGVRRRLLSVRERIRAAGGPSVGPDRAVVEAPSAAIADASLRTS